MAKSDKVSRTLHFHAGPRPKTWPDREDLPFEDGGGTGCATDEPKPGGGVGPAEGDAVGPADGHCEET